MKSIENFIVCLPGFNTQENSGGAGYYENRVVEVKNIEGDENTILWPVDDEDGIYKRAIRPATQWEAEHGEIQLIPDYEIY